MAEVETEHQTNGYSNANDDEDERGKMRPADIDAVSNQKSKYVFCYCINSCLGCKRNGTTKKS